MKKDGMKGSRALMRTAVMLALICFLYPGVIGGCGGGGGSADTGGGGSGEGPGAGIDIMPGGTLASEPETYYYVDGGTERQTLDLYRINGISSPRPALVWFHGGGWVINSKTDIEGKAFDIAEAGGFHLISVNYRLAGQDADKWPGIIREVKSAIRWIKLNADTLGIDPDQIIVTGESAGAHLAAMIAFSAGVADLEGSVNPGATSDVAAAVLFYGPYDFDTIVDQAKDLILAGKCGVDLNPLPVFALLDCPIPDNILDPLSECNQADLEEASPVTHVDPSDPPAFVAAGTDDCFVPWMQALDLENALNAAGVKNEVSITQGGVHDADTLDVTPAQVVEFLSEK